MAGLASVAHSQTDRIIKVTGYLVDNSGKPIQFAHVVNVNRHTACISDTAGRFRAIMMESDTVRISCLGYEPTGFSLRGLPIPEGESAIEFGPITMYPKTYELSQVSIYAERWKSFLYDYEHVEPTEEPFYVSQIEHWRENLINTEELKQITRAANGSGFSLNFDRKRKKAEQKIEEFKRQEQINLEANLKYNPKVVADITGMSIEDSEKFISHFKLDRKFIISRNDYDLYLIIKQLYKEYKP
ncbi:MAG: carboxypeptidase-like regulatory domain-containing protein [Bacteroidales bacterium]|nr:carboxypeptidase-like regulatory domain-containing protein [Bacteroidales bacterium]